MTLRLALLLLLASASLPATAMEAHHAPGGENCRNAADEDPTNPRPSAERSGGVAAETPERTAAPRGGNAENGVRMPRWHSFLPGMFR